MIFESNSFEEILFLFLEFIKVKQFERIACKSIQAILYSAKTETSYAAISTISTEKNFKKRIFTPVNTYL